MNLQFLPIIPPLALMTLLLPLLVVCVVMLVRRPRLRLAWARRLLMVLLLLVIALRPFSPSDVIATERKNANVIFVVDQTGSMNAEDYNGSKRRVEGMRADAAQITDRFAGARFAIISFDSAASRQLPLTTDSTAVQAWFDTMRPEPPGFSSGSNIDRAQASLDTMVRRTAEDDPESQIIVIVMSDGENTDGKQSVPFSSGDMIDAGAVLGYGTTAGGTMRVHGGKDDGEVVTDSSGQPGRSRLDEGVLKEAAAQLGVPYIHRTEPGQSLEDAASGVELRTIDSTQASPLDSGQDWYWIPAIALGALAVWELAAMVRRLPRSRRRREEDA
ncbi:VWA domain-containing protein [Helcobacillus massiliensis]|uniref:Ca-activated chloride channel family protein n=1 Tax=Helcobacillus massiliensis TaxID=521392 RepID=A0A839QQT2_9MICO|nr:vWA domain-containing protein [Helcobacillus massiliensis]MBB3022135.1 Ca-activated chloride channel family protein [Helcobacillus massiliensis]MCT1557339.1 VWA domain-containing protein [Helcobacillus massiliensis]MCT2037117.1 VWA domain-containing protein [Helcobacillus massiliensis]MCT2331624.1 VWA domain-containing protein [Helcobacillus massiliensis]MDK7742088.1 VWA domain-containing protein [Helcobacillus massiliensis]